MNWFSGVFPRFSGNAQVPPLSRVGSFAAANYGNHWFEAACLAVLLRLDSPDLSTGSEARGGNNHMHEDLLGWLYGPSRDGRMTFSC